MKFKDYLLDTNIVSKLLLPKHPENQNISMWFVGFLSTQKIKIYLPEIVSYETRRGLHVKKIKEPTFKGLERFESFSKYLNFLPINSNVFRIAEELWAKARCQGCPTADDKSLDADVLLAAQAIEIEACVITENVKHLEKYVATSHWENIS